MDHVSPSARVDRRPGEAAARALTPHVQAGSAERDLSPASVVGPRHGLTASQVIRLQRTLGNSATTRIVTAQRAVIQRKPADIDGTHALSYDATGKLLNVAAARAADTPRTRRINAQMTDGWVTPNQQLIGGHLFKAEFGGPDDDSNVVPWIPGVEAEFGLVETDYKKAADADATNAAKTNTAFTATIKTKATFVDRPDLLVSDGDLTNAGWTDTQPGRDDRKKKYTDVAENFSGIPTVVSVSITGLSSGVKAFSKAGAAIAPTFTRNDLAIQPGYVLPGRFKRKATEARVFPVIPDWLAFKKAKANAKAPADVQRHKKLNHVASRHGADFGVPGNGFADLERLEGALNTFIKDTNNEQIEGIYLLGKIDVLHYVNAGTKQWVSTTPTGELVAGFKLSQLQFDKLLSQGTVG
jgi:hypothetical protein